jgi:hypothetical protein
MNLLNFKILMKPTQAATLIAACALVMACTKGGSISSSGSSSSIDGTLTLDLVYPSASGASWTPIMSGTRYYVKGLAVTVTGLCSRGIQTIKVNEGGSNYSETATCTGNGTFTWNKTYTAVSGEGDKTLQFTAYDTQGAQITSATASKDVRIDATAPNVTAITAPSGSPYSHSGSVGEYTIEGTVSIPDVDHLTGPGGITITPDGSGHWSYLATLTSGSSLDFTFYTWDLAGNESAGVTQTILWSPSLVLTAGGVIGGGIITDSSAAAAVMEVSHQYMSGESLDSSSNAIETGFNYIINKARGL